MNRPVTAVFAALEALLVAAIGIGVPVVALTFLWAFQYGLQVDWSLFWRIGVDAWLVGHGADLTVTLSKSAAAATGIAGAGAPIVLSIAALGFALTTVLLGARAGRRLAETEHRVVGSAAAIVAFAVVSAIVTATATQPSASVSIVQGTVWPTVFFGVPLLAAVEVNRRRRGQAPGIFVGVAIRAYGEIPRVGRVVAEYAVRSGAAASVAVFAVAGLLVALLLASHYATVVSLYESAHGGVLGGLALTLGQLALLPNLVAWAASWLVGPGFAIGAGSSVSPLGTTLGPMPSIPFLGALPTSTPGFAFIGVLVPVVASFVLVTLLRPRLQRTLGSDDSLLVRVIAGASTGVVAGLLIGIAAALSAGSAGPGRLAEVGPNGLVVGAFAALEVGVPAMLALVVRTPDVSLDDLPTLVADRRPKRAEPAEKTPSPKAATQKVPATKTAAPSPSKPERAPARAAGEPKATVPAARPTTKLEQPLDADAHADLTRGLPPLSDVLQGEGDERPDR